MACLYIYIAKKPETATLQDSGRKLKSLASALHFNSKLSYQSPFILLLLLTCFSYKLGKRFNLNPVLSPITIKLIIFYSLIFFPNENHTPFYRGHSRQDNVSGIHRYQGEFGT